MTAAAKPVPETPPEAVVALAALHARLVDAAATLAEGLGLAEKPNMRALLDDLHGLCLRQAEALAAALSARGAPLDAGDGASLRQRLDKAILAFRAALTGLGDNVIPALRDEQERILALQDAALGAGPDPALAALVAGQRAETAARVAMMREMERAAEI